MHRLWLKAAFGVVILLGTAPAGAGAAGWAESLFLEKGHDFGPVPRGGKVHHDFLITNRLAEPVTIANIRASCGCTSGKTAATLLQPGQSGVVEAEMDTRNFVGPKATTLYVSLVTAGGREGEAALAVSANILSDIVLNPGTIDFGTVARGQTPSQVMTIDRVGTPNWRAERMVSSSRVLNATLTETSRNGSDVSYSLSVSLKPDAPPGVVRDEIRILTNDPETASIPILVTAQVRGDLTAKPSVLAMGKVPSRGATYGRFLLMSSRPFSIVSVEGTDDGFRPGPIERDSKPVHVVTFVYRPEEGSSRGELRHVFRVHTDLPGEPPMDLTATLQVDP